MTQWKAGNGDQFVAVDVIFRISPGQKLPHVGSAQALVESLSNGISELDVVDKFCSNTIVEFRCNPIIAAVYGSFALIRRNRVLAYIHVVPKDACRTHRLYYKNGDLFCTGEKYPSKRCSTLLCNRDRTTCRGGNVDGGTLDTIPRRSEVTPGDASRRDNAPRASAWAQYATGSTTVDRETFGRDENDWIISLQQNGESPSYQECLSTWLTVSPWLNGSFQAGGFQQLTEPKLVYSIYATSGLSLCPQASSYPQLTVRRSDHTECSANSNEVVTSPVVFYPLQVADHEYVLHIFRQPGTTLISSELVLNTMQSANVIGSGRRKCRQPETFLLDKAMPGTYTISSPLLDAKVHVVILSYELPHAGHRGRFACGYTYFLCGLPQPTAYRVILRAEMNRGRLAGHAGEMSHLSNPLPSSNGHGSAMVTWSGGCHDPGGPKGGDAAQRTHHGSSNLSGVGVHTTSDGGCSVAGDKMRITISRSYSGDCQALSLTHAGHPLAGPRTDVPPLPAMAVQSITSLPFEEESNACVPLADWLLIEANKADGDGPAKKSSMCERNDEKDLTIAECPESAVATYKPTAQSYRCIACNKIQPLSNRRTLRQHLKCSALYGAGVLLSNVHFPDSIILIESNCGKCERSHALISETSNLRSKTKLSGKVTTSNSKYIAQRRRLILRYDICLKLSKQAWFSICPEAIARHIGSRLAKLRTRLGRPVRVLEPFCGAGGNAVNCARMPHVEHVYAFDIDSDETSSAQQLSALYDVTDKVTIRTRDVVTLRPEDLPKSIDAVVFSPPWGGPEYQNRAIFDLAAVEKPLTYTGILHLLSAFTRNMAVLLPRNTALDQLADSACAIGSTTVELEQNVLAGRIKTVTVYYGDLAN